MSPQFKVFILILALITGSAYIYKSIKTSRENTLFGSSKSAQNL